MITAIFGPTCSGKTTAAQELALRLGRPLRSCGNVVREWATALGGTQSEVSDTVHREIDAETRQWVEQNPNGVVEGRFLDRVLDGIPEIVFVKLSADTPTRASRGVLRRSDYTPDDLSKSDRDDNLFRDRMYGIGPSNCTFEFLDTTHLTVEKCIQKIERLVRSREAARG